MRIETLKVFYIYDKKNFNSGFSCEVYWVYYNPKLRKKQQVQHVLSLNLIFTVKKQLKITLNVFVNKVKLPSSGTNESASSIPNSLFKTRIKVSGIQIPLFQDNYFQLQSCKPPPPHTHTKKKKKKEQEKVAAIKFSDTGIPKVVTSRDQRENVNRKEFSHQNTIFLATLPTTTLASCPPASDTIGLEGVCQYSTALWPNRSCPEGTGRFQSK